MNDNFYKISNRWFNSAPFLAEFMLRFQFTEDKKISTIGVGLSGKNNISIHYNNEFISKLTESELEGVMVHEIMHLLLVTHDRGKGGNPKVFNIASDIAINNEIETRFTIGGSKLTLPKEGCRLSDIPDYKGPITAEEIYDYLMQNNIDDLSTMDIHDFLDSLSEEDRIEFERQIEKIKQNAKAKSYGNMSEGMKDTLTELTQPKKISFRQILRKEMQNYTFGNDMKINSFAKANRRGFQTLPGKKKVGKRLNIVIDTSGSCYSKEIQSVFFSEIDYISSKLSDIKIIEFDTEIHQTYKYRKGAWKRIKFEGGGGTEIQPVFDKLQGTKDGVIIFTDGYFDKNIETYGLKPLWIILDNDNKFKVTKNFLND